MILGYILTILFFLLVIISAGDVVMRKRNNKRIETLEFKMKRANDTLDGHTMNINYIAKDSERLKAKIRALEKYFDLESEELGSINGFLQNYHYTDRRVNKLRLLYDHLNLDIKTIDAKPVQYKLVKKGEA